MKTTCTRSGCARDSAVVRTRAAPASTRARADAVVTLDGAQLYSQLRVWLARFAYLGFLVAVPGSLLMLALWALACA
ncbi:MAG: hypothetical protein WDN04_16365 [Rhodospirillales bacterium]